MESMGWHFAAQKGKLELFQKQWIWAKRNWQQRIQFLNCY